MSPIPYEDNEWSCSFEEYLNLGKAIADDTDRGDVRGVVDKINTAFFGGGALDPKSFSDLLSIQTPGSPTHSWRPLSTQDTCKELMDSKVKFGSQNSVSGILGYVEVLCSSTLPFILPAIIALGHLVSKDSSYNILKGAVVKLRNEEANQPDGKELSLLMRHYTNLDERTRAVFIAAIAYTVHRNHLIGSGLTLIGIKPLVRVIQGIAYHCLPRAPQPSLNATIHGEKI